MCSENEDVRTNSPFYCSQSTDKWYRAHCRFLATIIAVIYTLITLLPSMEWFVPLSGEAILTTPTLLVFVALFLGITHVILGPILKTLKGKYQVAGGNIRQVFAGRERPPAISFSSVVQARVQRAQTGSAVRVRLKDQRGKVMVIHEVEDMAALLKLLEQEIPVPLDWTEAELSPWNRSDKLRLAFVIILFPLFLSISKFVFGT